MSQKIKKNDEVITTSDSDLRRTGGPLIPAGTKGIVEIVRNQRSDAGKRYYWVNFNEAGFGHYNCTDDSIALANPDPESDGPRTINLTPAGFAKDNPDAARNYEAAERAAEAQRNAISAQADFLRELVESDFGGLTNLLSALRKRLVRLGEKKDAEIEAIISEVNDQYEKLKDNRAAADHALLSAFAGKPVAA